MTSEATDPVGKHSDEDDSPQGTDSPLGKDSHQTESSDLRRFMQRIRRIEASSQDFDEPPLDGRTGNGWTPEKIAEAVFMVDPISGKAAFDEVRRARTGLLLTLKTWLRLAKNIVKPVGGSTVLFVPVWHLKGFHECYYLRSSSYKVEVKRDVAGVEVDGKSRDIMLEKKQRLISRVLKGRLSKLDSLFSDESKYFGIDDVTELASFKRVAEIFVGAKTGQNDFLDRYELSGWKLRRIFDITGLRVEGANAAVGALVESKEGAVAALQEALVKLPQNAKEILTNRFEITQLNLYYVPFYSITLSLGTKTESILIHGVTGDIVSGDLSKEILQRFR